MHELMFQAGVKGMSERSELIPCIYYNSSCQLHVYTCISLPLLYNVWLSFAHKQHFFHNPSSVDIGAVIQEAYHLQKTTPAALNPERMLGSFEPLTKGTYPVFNKYPKFIVDYQVQERERIRQEEVEYLRER